MKSLIVSATAVILFGASAFAGPSLDVSRAAKIASDYLASANFGPGIYVSSLVLDPGGMIAGKSSWVAKWSTPVVDSSEREVGLRVKMDGSIARLVEDRNAPKSSRREPGAQGIR